MLKKFLDKTLEAAKVSAQQMYGDDFSTSGKAATVEDDTATGSSSRQKRDRDRSDSNQQAKEEHHVNHSGVKFERSGDAAASSVHNPSPGLQALRRYVEEQESGHPDLDNTETEESSNPQESAKKEATITSLHPMNKEKKGTGDVYSRASIRTSKPTYTRDLNTSKQPAALRSVPKPTAGGSSRFNMPAQAVSEAAEVPLPVNNEDQYEMSALHERFDKLESLLNSAMVSSNLDFVSHPAYQKLLKAGISTSVISGWFSDIIKQGIDPYDQNEMFMSKLSALIRDMLDHSVPNNHGRYMLFAGTSGSGKTNLVMKLSTHPELTARGKVAVVTLYPEENESSYYTVLEPFCRDNGIPCYKINFNTPIAPLLDEWDEYDHILIDTPSISADQDQALRQYWKMRQLFAPLKPLEAHYVINAAVNSPYLQQLSGAHQSLRPDYVAITHLDAVSQWGPLIPFLSEMDCSARYTNSSANIAERSGEFNPTLFAHKVLGTQNY